MNPLIIVDLTSADTILETVTRSLTAAILTNDEVTTAHIDAVEWLAASTAEHIRGLLTGALVVLTDQAGIAAQWNEAIEVAIEVVESK